MSLRLRVDFRDLPTEGSVLLGTPALADFADARITPYPGMAVTVHDTRTEVDGFLAVDDNGTWTAVFDPRQLREVLR